MSGANEAGVELEYPTYKVKVTETKTGKLLGVTELPDPREAFCRHFNRLMAGTGFYAAPVLSQIHELPGSPGPSDS